MLVLKKTIDWVMRGEILGGLGVSQSPLKTRLNAKGCGDRGEYGDEDLEHLAPDRLLVFHSFLRVKVVIKRGVQQIT